MEDSSKSELKSELYEKYSYSETTPLLKQYFDIKFEHMDCLVLFRMGDFYELFFEDAIIGSKLLGITLTSKGQYANGKDIPMCGVPVHALEFYLNKLAEESYKIAICEQIETAEQAKERGYKSIVQRAVTRIITPGTITEESLLNTGLPNYLLSLTIDKDIKKSALAYADLSTGDFFISNIDETEISNALARVNPKEILLNEESREYFNSNNVLSPYSKKIVYQSSSCFALKKCCKIIENFYDLHSITALGEIDELSLKSAGSILEYVNITQKQFAPKLKYPKITGDNFLLIDEATRKNLELFQTISGQYKGSVLHIINKTITKQGSRKLHQYLSTPSINSQEINDRLDAIDFFINNKEFAQEVGQSLKYMADLDRLLTRISMSRSNPRDILSIKETLEHFIKLQSLFLFKFCFQTTKIINDSFKNTNVPLDLIDSIQNILNPLAENLNYVSGSIKRDYSIKLEELYNVAENHQKIMTTLKEKYRQELQIDNIRILHNNLLGLFIEIPIKQLEKKGDEGFNRSQTKFIHKQNTKSTIRYTTAELIDLETKINNSESLISNLENDFFLKLCEEVMGFEKPLRNLADCISTLDVFWCLAFIAKEYNYCRPNILADSKIFNIVAGRHISVEHFLPSNTFISNDCKMDQDKFSWLITGANMAGKSTFLRQNALIALLAQIGSYVPAESAEIGIVDKIFSRIGASDDLTKGHSTFMIEMLEVAAILMRATNQSLVILDEIGRGTSTYDGMAIAWATLEYLHDNLGCRTLFATHYHELSELEKNLQHLTNYTITIEEIDKQIIFSHKIKPGIASSSYGIHVASLAGLPKEVISRAYKILSELNYKNKFNCPNLKTKELDNLIQQTTPNNILENQNNKILDILKKLDPDNLTPKEALEILYKIKNQIDQSLI